jgi:DNA (cytosine-5)-methyltransferase 1
MGKHHDDDTDTLVAHALTSGGADASEDGTGRGTPLIAAPLTNGVNGNAGRRREDDFNLAVASSVRRLTPIECERLQGFPDGWTCLCSTDVCTCPDGPRYAALGNAVTVNVAEWIGHRIARAQRTDGQKP